MTICLVQRQKAFLQGYRLRVRELEKELEKAFQIGKKITKIRWSRSYLSRV